MRTTTTATAFRALEASTSYRITSLPVNYLTARAKSTSTQVTNDNDAESSSWVVPQLPRPLGIDIPPVSSSKTYVKESESLYDRDRSKAERKVLMKEASHGYFHDYNRARKGNEGKAWLAPKVLIKEDKALWFPNIAGKTLDGEKTNTTDMFKGKVSLVSIMGTRLSEEHAEAFTRPTVEDQKDNDMFNYVRINHQANPLKATLLSFFTSALKRQIPRNEWSNYLLARGEWSTLDVIQPMGIENRIVGYVYLVDKNCKIRWAGVGDPDEEEIESLRAATAVLLKRSA